MEKQRWEESEKEEESEEKKSEKRKSQKKEDRCARGRKVMKHSVFQCFVASASEVKAAGAEPFGQMRDQNLRAAAARSRF